MNRQLTAQERLAEMCGDPRAAAKIGAALTMVGQVEVKPLENAIRHLQISHDVGMVVNPKEVLEHHAAIKRRVAVFRSLLACVNALEAERAQ